MKKLTLTAGLILLAGPGRWARAQNQTLDHSHSAWNALLKKHVKGLPDGKQSRVNYKGFVADWVSYRRTGPGKGEFIVDPVKGELGSYDAIRAYLWAGLMPVRHCSVA